MKYGFDLPAYLIELEKIVNIDSGSSDLKGLQKMASYFKQHYLDLGLDVLEKKLGTENYPGLEIKNSANTTCDILIAGHMDTVFPAGTVNQRAFKVDGNRALGPGVVDMKASLLTLFYAIKALKESKQLDNINICIALNSDEEIGSLNSSEWLEELARNSRYSLVIEPARENGDLVSERRGLMKYQLEFHGKAAHSGIEPQKGRSAIHGMADWISTITDFTNHQDGISINFGLISGGTAANVISPFATTTLEIRVNNKLQLSRMGTIVQQMVDSAKHSGVTVKIKQQSVRPPMSPVGGVEALKDLIRKRYADVGIKAEFISTGGCSDANNITAQGVPTIDGLGPVGGSQHSVNEYLLIDSIEPRFQTLANIISQISSLN